MIQQGLRVLNPVTKRRREFRVPLYSQYILVIHVFAGEGLDEIVIGTACFDDQPLANGFNALVVDRVDLKVRFSVNTVNYTTFDAVDRMIDFVVLLSTPMDTCGPGLGRQVLVKRTSLPYVDQLESATDTENGKLTFTGTLHDIEIILVAIVVPWPAVTVDCLFPVALRSDIRTPMKNDPVNFIQVMVQCITIHIRNNEREYLLPRQVIDHVILHKRQ